MSVLSKISNWRMKIFLWIGLPVIAVAGLVFGSVDVMPAWQAKAGNGTAGTFTADREECGRRSCSFYGTWAASDGSATRTDVILYDEPDSLRVGGQVAALDAGARNGVFATAGGYTYLLVTGLTLGGAIAAVAWVVVVLRALRRRKAEPEVAAAATA
ncbi:MAG TPA: hypothetical protein VF163_14315 [Micromonosporaceae bacterium]